MQETNKGTFKKLNFQVMENFIKEYPNKTILLVLKKITASNCIDLNYMYLEKLLPYVKKEFAVELDNYIYLCELLEWVKSTIQIWKENTPNVLIVEFFCHCLALISKEEKVFVSIQKINVINELVDVNGDVLFNNSSLATAFIKLLCDILSHDLGFNWIKNSCLWKSVFNIYFYNSNLFVEREGLKFIKNFIIKSKADFKSLEKILQEVFQQLFIINQENVNENLILKIRIFRLLELFLKEFLFIEDNIIFLKLREIFDLEKFLKSTLENSEDERILGAASSLYITFLVIQNGDRKKLITEELYFSTLIEVFYILLKRENIKCVIKTAKFCQVLWSDINQSFNCKTTTGMNFIILQLVPVLMYNKKLPNTKMFDLYAQKLFTLTSRNIQKLAYNFRDVIRNQTDSKPRDWALKGVSSVISNIETLSHDEAVLIFQTMAYVSKSFTTENNCIEEELSIKENVVKEPVFCLEDTSLLLEVLNSLCLLIEKFKINWTECLETFCLLKITCNLLKNPLLPSVVVVQTLALVKLSILNFMSPNLALLLSNSEDSNFECLIPVLYKRLHDPYWEIRDSCIEVISVIADLAEFKYPAFQQLLIEKDYCSLVFNIMEGDSESYVKASALKALCKMMKIESLNQCLMQLGLPQKVIKLLETESEAIVRREAALIITEIYNGLNEQKDLLQSFYQIMSYTALCDLHWEVKVNSLIFWKAVIQHITSDQGMIDGSFPKVTFSKQNKKIVTLTNEEIKLRLNKILKELSEIGCLFVLMSTLNDDCDLPVIEKSAEILTDLKSLLNRYNILKPAENLSLPNRISLKRKNHNFTNFEKRKPVNLNEGNFLNEKTENCLKKLPANSDAVIEEIVNEMDINLLVNVCHDKVRNDILQKKELQKINPDIFLLQMQTFDSEKFLSDKKQWFFNVEIDLKTIINNIFSANSFKETNLLDCY